MRLFCPSQRSRICLAQADPLWASRQASGPRGMPQGITTYHSVRHDVGSSVARVLLRACRDDDHVLNNGPLRHVAEANIRGSPVVASCLSAFVTLLHIPRLCVSHSRRCQGFRKRGNMPPVHCLDMSCGISSIGDVTREQGRCGDLSQQHRQRPSRCSATLRACLTTQSRDTIKATILFLRG